MGSNTPLSYLPWLAAANPGQGFPTAQAPQSLSLTEQLNAGARLLYLEVAAYAHPWSRKHFHDSLQAGYPAVLLLGEALPGEPAQTARADGRVLLGYLVAMPGVDEVHLLNITVAPAHQRQGWARFMLDALVLWSRGQQAQWLWLEVRQSNEAARRLYERYGFSQVGLRKGYYPDGHLRREDAMVMSLNLMATQDTR